MAVSSGRLSNILHECFSNVWAFAMKLGGQGPTEWTAWVQTLRITHPQTCVNVCVQSATATLTSFPSRFCGRFLIDACR